MTNDEIIRRLLSLDLSTYPYDEVRELVSLFGPMIVRMTIDGNLIIERLRPEVGFTKRKDVTYKEGKLEDFPNRATIPGRSIFYGTIAHHKDNPMNRRYIAICESSSLLKKGKNVSGRESYTLSIWGIKRPLSVGFIVNDKAFENRNNRLLQDAKEYYNRNRSFIESPLQMDIYKDFVVEQFSNPVADDQRYKYIISATIADKMMYASGLDGIVYPSVKADGEAGLNIALKKECVDDALKLLNVEELDYIQNKGEGSINIAKGQPMRITRCDSNGLLEWEW
ncbi:MAG: hypothetical protein Q4F69_00750 [Bacteroidia bacterium]|nr:hypothetical protein [Bacteroidia bacterium]